MLLLDARSCFVYQRLCILRRLYSFLIMSALPLFLELEVTTTLQFAAADRYIHNANNLGQLVRYYEESR